MGTLRRGGGSVDMVTLNVLISVLLCFLTAALGYFLYRITTQLNDASAEIEDLKADLGGVFNVFMNKLEKFEDLVPQIEAPNPLFGLLRDLVDNQTPKDRDGAGQFVRAEVIHPSND